MIPKQNYELIKVCRQTMEEGIPLVCEDCGRVIFNIATIKGLTDGKFYNVGLTCVKKLLNKTIYFDFDNRMKYESELYWWNNAMNKRKWIEKKNKDNVFNLRYKEFIGEDSVNYFCIELLYKADNSFSGNSIILETKYKHVFDGLNFIP